VNTLLRLSSLQRSTQLLLDNARWLHTSFACYSLQEKAARNKLKLQSKKDKLKMSGVIKPSMTVRELADAMRKPALHVAACLEQIKFGPRRNIRDSLVIPNLDTIIKVVQISGFRHQLETSNPAVYIYFILLYYTRY
jgi:hypothetical protein